MTRRAWAILAVGLALAAAAGGGSLLLRSGPSSTSTPSPSWGMFSPVQWQTVRARLGERGFDPATAQVVGGTTLLPLQQPFALVAARSQAAGTVCFAAVRGTEVGATICRVTKPLMAFTVPGRITSVVGLAAHGIVGVSLGDKKGHVSGLSAVRVSGVLTFAGGYSAGRVLRAYGPDGRVVASLDLAL